MDNEFEKMMKDVNSSLPLRKLTQLIDRTAMSADMKSLLADLAKVTVKVAGKILSIGRKILTFVFDVIKVIPTITLGVLAAIVISTLIASIPFLGGFLAAILTPILLASGVGVGALKDFSNDKLEARLDSLVDSFSSLKEV